MSSVTVTAKIGKRGTVTYPNASIEEFTGKVKLQACELSNFKGQIIESEVADVDEFGYIKTKINGLKPNTKYYLRVASGTGKSADTSFVGEFTTPPLGNHSFSFGVVSCSDSQVRQNQHKVWTRIQERVEQGELNFIYNVGDWFYTAGAAGVTPNNETSFYKIYDDCLLSTSGGITLTQRPLFQKTPIYYQWDDNDYGKNNADQTFGSRAAGLTAYKHYFPNPELEDSGVTGGVYYYWKRGRIRFVATDVRSERTPDNTVGRPNNAARYILHPNQEQWFKDQITEARAAGEVVVWVCTNPWIGPGAATGAPGDLRGNNVTLDWKTAREWNGYLGVSGTEAIENVTIVYEPGATFDFVGGLTGADVSAVDNWGTRQLQRDRLANHITGLTMSDRVIIISGDMHGFAFDDGYLHTITGGYKLDGSGNRKQNPNNGARLKVCHTAPIGRQDGNPLTFFQDSYSVEQVNNFYATKYGFAGSTGFAWMSGNTSRYPGVGNSIDSRGGPYYIGPISMGTEQTAFTEEFWYLAEQNHLMVSQWDTGLGTVPLTNLYTSGYGLIDVTDLGGSTLGFRFRAVLTYPAYNTEGITMGPITTKGGCLGATCPERTIIDQSWTVDLS